MEPAFSHTHGCVTLEVGVFIGEDAGTVGVDHGERQGDAHHVARAIAHRIRHTGLSRGFTIAGTVDDHLGAEGEGAAPVVGLDGHDTVACERWRSGNRVEMYVDARFFQHLEHGESGGLVVVDNLRAEVLQRRVTHQGRGRIEVHHAAGEFFEHTADGATHRIAAAPRHAGAKRHDAADLGGAFEQADLRATPRGGNGSAKAGGATADDQDVCNLFASSGHDGALVQKKPVTIVGRFVVVFQQKLFSALENKSRFLG